MTKNELKLAVKQIIKKNINKIITYQDFEFSDKYNLWSRDEDDKEYRLYYQSKKTNDIGEFVCINITIKKDKKHTIEVEIF